MNRLQMVMVAVALPCALFATDFYVNSDLSGGNDAYDGRAAVWDGVHGPRLTLASISNLVTATTDETQVGDTVYLAEGDYNVGTDASGMYRAELPAGTRLVGVGNRDRIRIFGSATDGTRSTTPLGNDLRCLKVGAWTSVKNVTLCNGRAYGVNGGACLSDSSAFFVRCAFSNNYVNANGVSNRGRGGALASGTAIRCLFKKNNASSTGKCMYGAFAWNCVFDQTGEGSAPTSDYATYLGSTYNCTFTGTGGCSPRSTSYNALIRVPDGGSSDYPLYHSLLSGSRTRSLAGDDRTQADLGLDQLQIDGEFIPVRDMNLGIDYGSNLVYEANFPASALVTDQKNLDFNGNPRKRGTAIDVGACESDPDARRLVINDAQGGLTLTGAVVGETMLRNGQTNDFVISRNYTTQKLCTGVTVNGEFFSFTGTEADLVYSRTFGYGDPTATNLVIEAVYAEHNDWYVDPDLGTDGNSGYTKYAAFKTLAAAMTNALIAANDVVHAAPGVYKDEPFGKSGSTSNRVTVAADVGLVADGARGSTAIEGFKASDPNASIRCVGFASGNTTGYVKGFTLRNGSTATPREYYDQGGGIYGGVAIDCVITNCSATRGGGAASAQLIRCRVTDCSTIGTSPSGAAFYQCSAYDSYIEGSQTQPYVLRNCYVLGKTTLSSGTWVGYNSYIEQAPHTSCLTNCLYTTAASGAEVSTSTQVSAAPELDAQSLRPTDKDSLLVDAGMAEYHRYPTGFEAEAERDWFGGQRVYNGGIDIGCGEFDWRGIYGNRISTRKDVTVTRATANVTNGVDGVVLQDGDLLTICYDLKVEGACSAVFVLQGDGAVTATVDGETVTPVAGICAFSGKAGTNLLTLSFAGSGTATVMSTAAPAFGLMIFYR